MYGDVNATEITLILHLVRSDVKIGPARAHGNRLTVRLLSNFLE